MIIHINKPIKPLVISMVTWATHTGLLERRITVQVSRIAIFVMLGVLYGRDDTGYTTARNLRKMITIFS